MTKRNLFEYLKEQENELLIDLLQNCYSKMSSQDKCDVFGSLAQMVNQNQVKSQINPEQLLQEIQQFQEDSLNEVYYAPFDMNSKNYMNIPKETDEWFDKIADLLADTMELANQNPSHAVACFKILFDLIKNLEWGDNIVFADECGMWMAPIDEKACVKVYIEAAACVLDVVEYVDHILPLIRRDCHASTNHAYTIATGSANPEQLKFLQQTVSKHKIRNLVLENI
ncbi:MAG: hypothetical protein QG673_197 [Pseudomonadota bacterium]|nr:hypothetical protein [Pseudomonadota bacterium]